jgi:hypothetical protein
MSSRGFRHSHSQAAAGTESTPVVTAARATDFLSEAALDGPILASFQAVACAQAQGTDVRDGCGDRGPAGRRYACGPGESGSPLPP